MNALWLALLMFAASPGPADGSSADSETARTNAKTAIDRANIPVDTASSNDSSDVKLTAEEPLFPPRKPAEMRTAVRNAMRATATATDPAARDFAIRKLILILLELEQDKNLTHDERVELRTLVHSRLTSLEKTLRSEADRADAQRNSAPSTTLGRALPQASVSAMGTNPSRTSVTRANEPKTPVASQTTQILGQMVNVQPVNRGIGAFNQPIGARNAVVGSRNNGQPADYGEDLVSLIQTVIAPRTWDVNGGPGSVVYYRNLQALVIRAPSEVHGKVGDALGQLRK